MDIRQLQIEKHQIGLRDLDVIQKRPCFIKRLNPMAEGGDFKLQRIDQEFFIVENGNFNHSAPLRQHVNVF